MDFRNPSSDQSRQFGYRTCPLQDVATDTILLVIISFTTLNRCSSMYSLFFKVSAVVAFLSGALYYSIKSNVRIFFVVTGSMEPLISVNSLIISKNFQGGDIRVGTVVVFNDKENGRITSHRVNEVTQEGLITKGDANNFKDRYVVKQEDVLGQVIGVIPFTTIWLSALQLVFSILLYFLGVLSRYFLLFLKYGFSCPTTAVSAFRRFCIFRSSKATIYSRQTISGVS